MLASCLRNAVGSGDAVSLIYLSRHILCFKLLLCLTSMSCLHCAVAVASANLVFPAYFRTHREQKKRLMVLSVFAISKPHVNSLRYSCQKHCFLGFFDITASSDLSSDFFLLCNLLQYRAWLMVRKMHQFFRYF